MAAPDPVLTAKVKIEIDIAEETPQAWLTAGGVQGNFFLLDCGCMSWCVGMLLGFTALAL